MPHFPEAVFFDVDGVLVDSLPQHLQICRDKAVEFGLALRIPTVEEFRELVREGKKVSPMRYFFLTIGFPEELVDRAVADYKREFMQRYRPKAFSGVDQMLATLRSAMVRLGLVTSNTRANVIPPLLSSMECFDERCLFFFDRYLVPKTKTWCLAEGGRLLGIRPDECVYVGDQPDDARAAAEAGMRFLGVTYGWGISDHDEQYPRAKGVLEIPDKLIDLHTQSRAHNSHY
jgi:N-acetyl-D-muramate 6-phosphate phosphatase